MKELPYTEEEKEKMIASGRFPICYDNRHCNTCIRTFRKMVEENVL